ncbi:Ribose-phosphate pyrophosphokinase 2, chloroplastic [Capsicum annuum]|nr:Ribose-phosphate pyrophosphokinase 2, chloroplastic [Capsicum annuum]
MACSTLPSSSSTTTTTTNNNNNNSLFSSSFSRCSSLHRTNFIPKRTRGPNYINCEINEPANEKPIVPIINDETLPKFLRAKRLQNAVGRNNTKLNPKLKLFSGTANPSLSQEIVWNMGLELGKINIKRFADGEIYIQLQESVRGCDVFLIQPTCPPANENLMELCVMVDACRRASAKNITAVIPYFGYARADRKAIISIEVKESLQRNFEEEEVLKCLKSCVKDKAPGPDGFTMGFFIKYWEIVKHE